MSIEFHHKTYCGIQIGLVHAGFPFTRIGIYQKNLIIESLIGKYSFKAENIIRIDEENHWMGTKYILKHNRSDYPPDIQLFFIKNQGTLFFETIKESGFFPKGKIDDLPLPRSPIAFNIPRVFVVLILYLQLRLFINKTLFVILGFLTCCALEKNKFFQNFFLLPDRHYSEVQQWNRAAAIMFLIFMIPTFIG